MKCQKCDVDTFLPFKCPYCEGHFCAEHRLPENHDCPEITQAHLPRQETSPVVIRAPKSDTYAVTYPTLQLPKSMARSSSKEILHLTVAAALVVGVGLSLSLFNSTLLLTDYTWLAISVSMFALSFFLHEFAHKLTAQKYRLWSEFRLSLLGAVVTALSILSPLKVISPGTVTIKGYADKRVIGRTSLAGPATNIVLGLIFLTGVWLTTYRIFLLPIAAFNVWISIINLIPVGMLDGFKIFHWNKHIWAVVFTISVMMVISTFMLVYA